MIETTAIHHPIAWRIGATAAGQIGLQSEGGEIHFRKIELTSIE